MLKSDCVQSSELKSESLTITEVIDKFCSSIDSIENFELNEENEFLLRYIFSFYMLIHRKLITTCERINFNINININQKIEKNEIKIVKSEDKINIYFYKFYITISFKSLHDERLRKIEKEEMNEIIKKANDKIADNDIRVKKLCDKVKELLKHKDNLSYEIIENINFKELFDNFENSGCRISAQLDNFSIQVVFEEDKVIKNNIIICENGYVIDHDKLSVLIFY